jgi:hypothetical protein
LVNKQRGRIVVLLSVEVKEYVKVKEAVEIRKKLKFKE